MKRGKITINTLKGLGCKYKESEGFIHITTNLERIIPILLKEKIMFFFGCPLNQLDISKKDVINWKGWD